MTDFFELSSMHRIQRFRKHPKLEKRELRFEKLCVESEPLWSMEDVRQTVNDAEEDEEVEGEEWEGFAG